MIEPAIRKVTLPTRSFLAAIWVATLLAGGIFAGGALILGMGATATRNGGVAAGVVGVIASLVVLALRPWQPRALMQWPVVWMAGSFVRLLATIGGTYLLYSATPLGSPSGGKSLWLAVAFAYVAAMVGETRVYAMSMRRFAPGAPPAPGATEASTSE